MMNLKKLALLGLSLVLHACGGGDGPSTGLTVPAPATPLTGVFLDSAVINVDYANATGSRSGVTNASGEFEYVGNETLFFSIGDLDFPQVSGAPIVTPIDMANTLDITDFKVTNIVRLLLTLDQDGDPSNGITITDTAKSVATQVDFFLSEAEFEASSAVTNLIFNAGQDTVVSGLASLSEARTHFEAELIANGVDYATTTVAKTNDAEILQYLADNGLTATKHSSGLYYNIITEGTGDSPTVSSTVEVLYKGYLTDGEVFDESTTGVQFPLSTVISGWQLAIPLLKPGGEIIFFLPSALAYGADGVPNGSPPIPGDAVLIFEVELISIL